MNLKLIIISFIVFTSCKNGFYGKYNTNYSKNKSAFFEIILNSNGTAEKKEIHTIAIYSIGRYEVKNNIIICYFEKTENNFPADTLVFKLKGKKLYFIDKSGFNNKFYLKKNRN